jgi:hypothetical protein
MNLPSVSPFTARVAPTARLARGALFHLQQRQGTLPSSPELCSASPGRLPAKRTTRFISLSLAGGTTVLHSGSHNSDFDEERDALGALGDREECAACAAPCIHRAFVLRCWTDSCLCWKYALEPTGFDPLVGSDGFDPLWCKSPNGPQML